MKEGIFLSLPAVSPVPSNSAWNSAVWMAGCTLSCPLNSTSFYHSTDICFPIDHLPQILYRLNFSYRESSRCPVIAHLPASGSKLPPDSVATFSKLQEEGVNTPRALGVELSGRILPPPYLDCQPAPTGRAKQPQLSPGCPLSPRAVKTSKPQNSLFYLRVAASRFGSST